MTLIVGLFCTDALLFCSDHEEQTGIIGKRSVAKLYQTSTKYWSMLIATAGHSALCDVAWRQIQEAAKQSGARFISDHQTIIGDVLAKLYEKYIFNKLIPESKQHNRKISLIIGICSQQPGEQFLYKTDDEILHPHDHYACAGYGEDIAQYFLDRLYDHNLCEGEASTLMRFIIREAKASVQTVGGTTEMAAIHRSGGLGASIYGVTADEKEIPWLWDCVKPFWKYNTGQSEEHK